MMIKNMQSWLRLRDIALNKPPPVLITYLAFYLKIEAWLVALVDIVPVARTGGGLQTQH